MNTTRLTVTIGPKPTILQTVMVYAAIVAAMLAFPVANSLLGQSNLAIDILCGVFGFAFVLALVGKQSNKVKSFKTREEAAEWVKTWGDDV